MSVCEFKDTCYNADNLSPEEKMQNIQNELLWGLTYRNYKENEKKKPMLPVHSPINIPFELCRAELMMQNKKKPKNEDLKIIARDGIAEDEPEIKRPKKRKFSAEKPKEKPTLLDRNVWSQSQYMNFLSIPNPKFYEEPTQKKYKKRCELEPCPPRFIQLAVPNKRRVFANWKEYADRLPTEMLMRYEEILHTDQNLEPREARYYYKKLDRIKRKEKKRKRLEEKKKKMRKERQNNWQKTEIDDLAQVIVDYIKDEPLFALNYKQMLLSDGILDRLDQTKNLKKPTRKTKNHYKKTMIEVSDKFAIWIDTLTRFVDVQAIESDADIPPLSISSMGEGEGEEDEGEDESDYDYSTDDELKDSQLFEKTEGWGEAEDGYDGSEVGAAESFIEGVLRPGEGEDGTDIDNMLQGLDGDVLDKLIQILKKCSDEFLNSEIDSNKMPGETYADILQRLQNIRDALKDEADKQPFLEPIMVEWALKNDPDNVDEDILKKIHQVANILEDCLFPKKKSGKPGEEGAGEEGDKGEGKPGGEGPGTPGEGAEGEEGGEENVEKTPSETQGGEGGEETTGEEGEEPGGEADKEREPIDEEGEEEGGTGGEGKLGEGGAEGEEGEEGAGGVDEGGESGEGGGSVSTAGAGEGEGEDFSKGTFGEGVSEIEGGTTTMPSEFELEGEEGLGGPDGEGEGEPGKGVGVSEVDGIKPPKGVKPKPGEPVVGEAGEEEGEGIPEKDRLEGKIIPGHKPSKVFEHSPDTVCCLSLKTWAVWLLEITHNAHNWTKWMSCVIQKVREYAGIVRGDVKEPSGETKVLKKAEWRKFIKEAEESIDAWRQYSTHVKDLSQSIVDTFHEKMVNCCPKCLQDNLITDVVVAHDTLQALTEAISCAAYWQRCLDTLVDKTCGLTTRPGKGEEEAQEESEESSEEVVDLEAVSNSDSTGSVYEIEGLR